MQSANPPTVRDHVSGLIVAAFVTLIAYTIAVQFGLPLTLMALLAGLCFNKLSKNPKFSPGLSFAARDLLRVAIVLIGARITFAQIAALGPQSLIMVALTVGITISIGLLAARALGLSAPRGLLAGGAVAICGGSAALAIAATLGEKRISPGDLAMTLVGIATMSAAALILYPAIAIALGLTDAQAGYLLGASIHDVAQAVGAGYAFSADAGETATIVKLARVALLAPVLAILALFFPADSDSVKTKAPLVPWFILGFFGVAALNSASLIPVRVASSANAAATGLLALSVAATAIRTPIADLLKAGPRPLLTIAAASFAALALSLAYAMLVLE